MHAATHPTPDRLAAYSAGKLPPAEAGAVEDHILNCFACGSALGRLPAETLAVTARAAAARRTSPIPDVPPELIDHPRYRIRKKIGAGGMGVVFKAEHIKMGRVVALKVMARRYTANASAVDRFQREVRAAARLNHPNIVTAHDADEAHGLHFLVMECVDGTSLDRVVDRRGPLAVPTAVQCARQALAGLQHAFEHGMVHRDVKPHNLMITRKGQVKVLDFGLARLAHDASPANADGTPGPAPEVTAASLVMGTPDYLAPEQARNSHDVDTRADVYALGCTLYFLLTGRPPYADAGSAMDKMIAHTSAAPPRPARPDVPDELARVLAKMMAKEPADRYETPALASAALAPFAKPTAAAPDPVFELPADEPIVADAPPRRSSTRLPAVRRRRKAGITWWPFVAAGVAVVVFGAWLGSRLVKFARPPEPPGKAAGPVAAAEPRGPKADARTPPTPAKAAGPRVLILLPPHGLWYADYKSVRNELDARGAAVTTASLGMFPSRLLPDPENRGADVMPDVTVRDVDPATFAAVVVVGFNVEELWKAPHTGNILRKMDDDNKVVAAVCGGQRLLVRAGLLQGKRAARTPQADGPGVIWVKQPVVADGHIVTAEGPPAAKEFVAKILELVAEK